MIDTLRGLLWVAASFVVTLLIASTFMMGRGGGGKPELDQREKNPPEALQLVGRTIAASTLIEAQSRAPILDRGITVPDTAIVVLLGAIGCSMNQMKVLQQWSQRLDAPYPVLAIYADYLMSEAASSHESLVLRRVSQAEFPFLA